MPETREFLAILTRHTGDGETVKLTFEVSQSELRKVQDLLAWGNRVLTVTVVKED